MAVATEDKGKLILEQINWDSRVVGAEIQVQVANGKAILLGTSDNEVAKRAAEEVAKHYPGIKEVENNIRIIPQYSNPHADTDTDLREKILYAFALNENIDESSISVFVNNGKVRLEGSVDAYWKKFLVEEIALSVNGIYEAENKLAVIPAKRLVDDFIARRINTVIANRRSIDPTLITIEVLEGIVTLTGRVPDRESHDCVINAAKYTAGVVEVEDRLIIGHS